MQQPRVLLMCLLLSCEYIVSSWCLMFLGLLCTQVKGWRRILKVQQIIKYILIPSGWAGTITFNYKIEMVICFVMGGMVSCRVGCSWVFHNLGSDGHINIQAPGAHNTESERQGFMQKRGARFWCFWLCVANNMACSACYSACLTYACEQSCGGDTFGFKNM